MTKKKINDKFNDVMGVDPVEEDDKKKKKARTEEDDEETKAFDLILWERKAIHDFNRRGRVYRSFVSDSISEDEHEAISAALKAAQTAQEVKAAFKRSAVDTLLDSVDKDARAWADEVTSE